VTKWNEQVRTNPKIRRGSAVPCFKHVKIQTYLRAPGLKSVQARTKSSGQSKLEQSRLANSARAQLVLVAV
jgi:hypothetical protein